MDEKEMSFDTVAQETTEQFENTENLPQAEAAPQEASDNQALETAVEATGTAVRKQEEINMLAAQLEAERAKNEQLSAMLAQQNAEKEKELTEELAQEAPVSPPVLNIDPFDDEEAIREKTKKYNEDYDLYVRAKISGEFAPMMEFSKKAMAERERADALSAVKAIEGIGDFEAYIDKVDMMLKNNKSLKSDAPLEERMINAYLIARGYDSLNAKEPTVEEAFEKYGSNEEFIRLFTQAQINRAKENQNIPPFPAAGGVFNASPNVKEAPKNWDDVLEQTKDKF